MDEDEILDDITKESGEFVAQMEQLSAFFKGLVTIKVDENLFVNCEVAILMGSKNHRMRRSENKQREFPRCFSVHFTGVFNLRTYELHGLYGLLIDLRHLSRKFN